jgi:hypothetical protein
MSKHYDRDGRPLSFEDWARLLKDNTYTRVLRR